MLSTDKSKGKSKSGKVKGCWYNEGLRFECQRCGNCCRGEPGYVWVSTDEIKRIAAFMGISLDEFGEVYLRKVNAKYSLIEFSDGDCVMYDNGCKIYSVRPCQCTTYPFWSDNVRKPSSWKETGKGCPGVGKGPLYRQEEIQNIIEVQQRYESQG